MSGAAVFIATTVGPVRVRQIRRDTSIRAPAVSVNLDTRRPELLEGYQEFVGQPNGVIFRFTGGEERFRTQISADIVDGQSWRLGMFVAFALRQDDALCERSQVAPTDITPEEELQDAEQLIWATGEVKTDLSVESVTDIPLKLRQSEALFMAAAKKGLPILLLAPEANRSPEVVKALDKVRQRFNAEIRFLSKVEFWRYPWERQEGSAASPVADDGFDGQEGGLTPEAKRTRAFAFWRQSRWGSAVALLSLVFVVAFFTNFMAVQDRACSFSVGEFALSDTCGAAGLGNKPTQQARLAFEAIEPGDCDALRDFRDRYPDGPLHDRAVALIADQRTIEVKPDLGVVEHSVPWVVAPHNTAGSEQLTRAKAMAQQAAERHAEFNCRGFAAERKYLSVEIVPPETGWICQSLRGKKFCSGSGGAVCSYEQKIPRTETRCGVVE